MENKTGNIETMRAYKFRICPDTKMQKAIYVAISTHNSEEASGIK